MNRLAAVKTHVRSALLMLFTMLMLTGCHALQNSNAAMEAPDIPEEQPVQSQPANTTAADDTEHGLSKENQNDAVNEVQPDTDCKAELFMEGIVSKKGSTEYTLNIWDDHALFVRFGSGIPDYTAFEMKRIDGEWQEPVVSELFKDAGCYLPAVDRAGENVYFVLPESLDMYPLKYGPRLWTVWARRNSYAAACILPCLKAATCIMGIMAD